MVEKKKAKSKSNHKETKEAEGIEIAKADISSEPKVTAIKAVTKSAAKSKAAPKIKSPFKYYGTGRRKEAIAKVWLIPGQGNVLVNERPMEEYFCQRRLLTFQVLRPFVTANVVGKYDVIARVLGGGVPGQAVAISMGIARALLQVNPEFKQILKKAKLLTRDSRMKERKKYGLKRARRAFQYTKR